MWCDFTCWLKDWQVLASGAVAGTLAIVAIIFSRIQLNYQRKESERALRRRIRASRAFLSVALDIFIEYLKECYTIGAEIRKGEKEVSALRAPPLSERALTNLQTLIEHLDEDYEKDVDILIKVVEIYQVQNARFRSVLAAAKDNSPSDREEYFKNIGRNAVFLETIVDSIFPFARNKQKHISLDFSEAAAANSFHVLESELPSSLRLGLSEDEMCTYMVDYVVNKAAMHHFPDHVREDPATSSAREQ